MNQYIAFMFFLALSAFTITSRSQETHHHPCYAGAIVDTTSSTILGGCEYPLDALKKSFLGGEVQSHAPFEKEHHWSQDVLAILQARTRYVKIEAALGSRFELGGEQDAAIAGLVRFSAISIETGFFLETLLAVHLKNFASVESDAVDHIRLGLKLDIHPCMVAAGGQLEFPTLYGDSHERIFSPFFLIRCPVD